MTTIRVIREIIKTKKAERESILNEKFKMGKVESKFKVKPLLIKAATLDKSPKTEPKIAKVLAQILARLLFLAQIKEPIAPRAKSKMARTKLV